MNAFVDATAVVIGHVAAHTKTIRVGSGGIMLPNHAPLVVAEQFGTLESLYPGRIDLGLGRAPGSDGRTAYALNPLNARQTEDHFPQQLTDLLGWLGEGLAANHPFAAIRAQPHRGAHQFLHRHHACVGAQRHMVTGRALQFDGVFEHQYAVAGGGDLGQQGIRQCGLAGTGASGDQDVLPLTHGMTQELGLPCAQDAVGHIAIQTDDAHGTLAQRKGRAGCGGRQDALEAFAGFWQFGGQERLAAMHLRADMGGDQADDAFAIGLGQFDAQRCAARGQPIHPQCPVGVEHHFHYVRVFQRGGNHRPHRRAQHLDAAILGRRSG